MRAFDFGVARALIEQVARALIEHGVSTGGRGRLRFPSKHTDVELACRHVDGNVACVLNVARLLHVVIGIQSCGMRLRVILARALFDVCSAKCWCCVGSGGVRACSLSSA